MSKKNKYTFITPAQTNNDDIKCVIEFVPMVKRNVGIGYVTENEATAKDLKKYPIVIRPWINKENIS